MQRLVAIGSSVLAVAGAALGYGLAAVFIIVMFAGGVYRTECTLENGSHTEGWDLGGSIPYLWSPGDERCEAHTLTRYVLGEVGVMKDFK